MLRACTCLQSLKRDIRDAYRLFYLSPLRLPPALFVVVVTFLFVRTCFVDVWDLWCRIMSLGCAPSQCNFDRVTPVFFKRCAATSKLDATPGELKQQIEFRAISGLLCCRTLCSFRGFLFTTKAFRRRALCCWLSIKQTKGKCPKRLQLNHEGLLRNSVQMCTEKIRKYW